MASRNPLAALRSRRQAEHLIFDSRKHRGLRRTDPDTTLSTLIQFGTVTVSPAVTLPATTVLPVIAKTGPVIYHAIPAGSAVFPLNAAPGEFVTIYGANLSTVTQLAAAQPYPPKSPTYRCW